MEKAKQFVELMEHVRRLMGRLRILPTASQVEIFLLYGIEQAQGQATLTGLSHLTRASKPAVSKTLRALEERGWIERVIDPDDRRVITLKATPQGQEVLGQYWLRLSDITDQVLEQMGEEDVEEMIRLFNKLHDILIGMKEFMDGRDEV